MLGPSIDKKEPNTMQSAFTLENLTLVKYFCRIKNPRGRCLDLWLMLAWSFLLTILLSDRPCGRSLNVSLKLSDLKLSRNFYFLLYVCTFVAVLIQHHFPLTQRLVQDGLRCYLRVRPQLFFAESYLMIIPIPTILRNIAYTTLSN